MDANIEPSRSGFRISLRSLFELTACIAIGIAASSAPKGSVWQISLPDFPTVFWSETILVSLSVALAIGLAQEARAIRRARVKLPASDEATAIGLSLAISWRWTLVALIGCCVLVRLLLQKKILQLPAPALGFDSAEYLTTYTWWFCIVVALTSALRRRGDGSFSMPRPLVDLLAFVSGAGLLAIGMIYHTEVSYLVHLACAGIDAGLVHSEGRYGLTTDAEVRWFAAYGAIGLAAWCFAAWILVHALRQGRRGETSKSLVIAATASLAVSAAYCVWFYRTGFGDASPDLAGQLGTTWALTLSGVILAVVAISAGAIRCASRRDKNGNLTSIPVEATLPSSPLCAVLMLAWVVWFVIDQIRVVVGYSTDWDDVKNMLADMAVDADIYMPLAIMVLMLRFVYRLWKHRGNEESVVVAPIDGRRLVAAWIALAALAVVGIPTIAASAFSFWMGPWYLW